MEKFLLIDGSSLLHRAFYALPLLTNNEGQHTNAVYGFVMMLNRIVKQEQPDYIVVCLDKSRITFRTEIAADYKGTRKATPSELKSQFALLKDALDVLNIAWEEAAGLEADDLLGFFSLEGEKKGLENLILTGDRDSFQLISEQTKVYLTKKGITDLQIWDKQVLLDKYALTPLQFIDLKALMGDSSDNISGVPGVGEKTALKLLAEFSSLDNLYASLEQVPGKLKEKLADNKELAFQSRTLATILRKLDFPYDWQKYAVKDPDYQQVAEFYQKMGFKTLLKTLPAVAVPSVVVASENSLDVEWLELKTEADVLAFMAEIQKVGQFSFYPLWSGKYFDGEIVEVALSIPHKAAAFSLNGLFDKDKLLLLKPVFEDANIKKILFGVKENIVLLHQVGIQLQGVTDDVALLGYLLSPTDADYKLINLAEKYLSLKIPAFISSTAEICYNAALVYHLAADLRKRLQAVEMDDLYQQIELPLAFVLAKMELTGIKVEGEELRMLSQDLEKKINILTTEIHALAGMDFNVNSPKQLGEVLFEKLNLPPIKKTKTGYSTNSDVLEQLQHPIAAKIIDYRTHAKLKSTYADGLWQLINPVTGKLHTSFKQTVTATGRLSSAEPNLQNIPVRLELGRKIRKVFVADRPQDVLLAADYSQIELRVLAHISQDEMFCQAFINNEDIHARTAAEVFGVALDQVTKEQRRAAKAVNFGIVYGISEYGLSQDLGIGRKQAKDYIEKYLARYPKVHLYLQEIVTIAKEQGYVTTLAGRRRYLPELASSNFNVRALGERMAMNTPIQGTAADIIKIAMINIDKLLTEQQLQSKMLLQVHDELIFNVVPTEQRIMPGLIKEQMEKAMLLSVPLVVDLKQGYDWYSLEDIDWIEK